MKSHQRSARPRGFTIVEVLVAVVVTAIGFAAIFSMQIGSIQGNVEAREMSAATNLAERYVAHLRRDAYLWTAGPRPQTPVLAAQPDTWHSLTPDPVDHNGRAYIDDDPDGSPLARQRFCVHYWLGAGNPLLDGIINVRVRVVWPLANLDRSTLDGVCPEERANGFVPDPARFRSVVLPAAVQRHES